jgi:hypothetical protein
MIRSGSKLKNSGIKMDPTKIDKPANVNATGNPNRIKTKMSKNNMTAIISNEFKLFPDN